MTPEQIDRVFGRGRLRMVTGEHVEVFREATRAGDRRRYTKRFLNTLDADFGQWTEREWRILARLIGHGIDCVPEVVQFDRGEPGGTQLVQTYDAGATVDQWATILPVSRGSRVMRHVFEDCAHWWALAHHCLRALSAIHELSVVHLDIKGDNVCIPVGPPGFDPDRAGMHLYPRFGELALIDFAFSLVSRERLTTALPIGWQTDYDYQSPRLLSALEAGRRGDLKPTGELDWRCDMYSLAAMLKRYLPQEDAVLENGLACGWSLSRAEAARELILALRHAHDRETALRPPHQELMQLTAARLAEADLSASLASGWTLERDANVTPVAASPLTPLTRLAPPIRVIVSPLEREAITAPPTAIRRRTPLAQSAPIAQPVPQRKSRAARVTVLATLAVAAIVALAAPLVDNRWPAVGDALRGAVERVRAAAGGEGPRPSSADAGESATTPQAPVPPKAASDAMPSQAPAAAPTESPAAAPVPAHTPPAATAAPRSATPPTPAPRVPTEVTRKAVQPTAKRPAPPAVATKQSVVRIASAPAAPAATAQPRIRFFVPNSEPGASAQPPAQVAKSPEAAEVKTEPVAAPAPESPRVEPTVTEAPKAPPSQPRTKQAPSPSVPASPPQSAIARDVQNVLGFLLGFAKRSDRATAPIEERAPPSSASIPAPSPPGDSDKVREPAPRLDPPPVIPVPIPAYAAVPAPSITPYRQAAPRAPLPGEVIARAPRADAAIAARAELDIARVLWLAGNAIYPAQERAIVDELRREWPSNAAFSTAPGGASGVARQLSESARQAYMVRDIQGAVNLQMRAFGADPGDAEIAGDLAFLYLKLNPPQAETARQVAMHAIGTAPVLLRSARVDDWHTLAVASALTGREIDATNAFYVTIALTRNLDRSCRLALSALSSYGDVLVVPVQAMMLRIRQRGREHESPNCTWPARWQSARRY